MKTRLEFLIDDSNDDDINSHAFKCAFHAAQLYRGMLNVQGAIRARQKYHEITNEEDRFLEELKEYPLKPPRGL